MIAGEAPTARPQPEQESPLAVRRGISVESLKQLRAQPSESRRSPWGPFVSLTRCAVPWIVPLSAGLIALVVGLAWPAPQRQPVSASVAEQAFPAGPTGSLRPVPVCAFSQGTSVVWALPVGGHFQTPSMPGTGGQWAGPGGVAVTLTAAQRDRIPPCSDGAGQRTD